MELYCFDESRISCQIHVGRQCSNRCSYKNDFTARARCESKTPFQTERYSRPRHLAASFPFPDHAKNRKTPFQIARFTGGPCIILSKTLDGAVMQYVWNTPEIRTITMLNVNWTDPLADTDESGRQVLKFIFKKLDKWTEFSWFNLGSSGGVSWTWWWTIQVR